MNRDFHDDTLTAEKTGRKARGIFLFEATFEYFVQILVTGAFLATLLSKNGVPDWLVGIVSSFISLTCIFQIFSASVVRKGSSVKRVIFLLALANELIFVFLYIIPIFPFSSSVKCIIFVLFIFLAYALYNLVNPLKFSWYMLFVRADQRGTYTAKKEIISLIGGIAFSFLMGSLSDYFTEKGQDNTAFLVSALGVFVISAVHLMLIAATPEHSLEVSGSGKNFFSSLKVLKSKTVLALIVIEILWKTATMITNPFYGIYQTSELGFTLTFVSLLTMVQAIVRSCVSPLMGKIADRLGWRINLSICYFAGALGFVTMVFCTPSNGAVMYLLHNIFYGISMAGVNSGLMNIYFDYVPVADRTATLGVKSAIGGVVGFLSTTVASVALAKIQKSGIEIQGTPVYAQQILSLVSAVICALGVVYVLVVVKRLKKIEN
jgi:hypothetical protein